MFQKEYLFVIGGVTMRLHLLLLTHICFTFLATRAMKCRNCNIFRLNKSFNGTGFKVLNHGVRKHKIPLKSASMSQLPSWSNCGNSNDVIRVSWLKINPSSIPLPGQIHVGFTTNVTEHITSPVKMSVKIQYHAWFLWTPIPCINGIGSCDYSDACEFFTVPQDQTCPAEYTKWDIPCHCPIPKAKYHVEDIPVWLPKESFIPAGDYEVRVTFSSRTKKLGCLDLKIKLK